MMQRCYRTNDRDYKRYGARGIVVCPAWHSFATFRFDMGERPRNLTLERNDNDGNYEPGNCRWATASRQARNRRNTPLLAHRGKRLSIKDWAERGGVPYLKFWKRVRMYGWSVGEALADGIKA